MKWRWQLTALLTSALLVQTVPWLLSELTSIPFYCNLNQFQCPSKIKQCIQSLDLCNGIKDCVDGSDENDAFCKSYECDYTHPINTVRFMSRKQNAECPSRNMCTKTAVYGLDKDFDIDKPWLCTGGQKDCADGSDEDPRYCETRARNCSLNAQGLFDFNLDSVHDTCPSKKYCVGKGKLCDGKKDCPDGSDEWTSFCKNLAWEMSFRCKDWGRLFTYDGICDGVKDCGDGSDEDPAFCFRYACPRSRGKKCSDGRTCLIESHICDGVKHCPDGSDEEASLCGSFKCPGLKYKCKDGKQCVGEMYTDVRCDPSVANGYPLCNDKSDANNAFCPSPAPNCSSHYNIRCKNGVGCIARTLLCDGQKDCEDGSDEGKFCETYDCRYSRQIDMTLQFILCKDTHTCAPGILCDGFADCTDGTDEDPAFCQTYKCPRGSQKCKNFPYQCVEDSRLCDGFKQCINGGDEDKVFCKAFKCPAGTQKCPNNLYECVDPYKLCDGNKDCRDGSDEDKNFCTTFKCSQDKQKCPKDGYECVDASQLCDGKNDCVNGGDEDPELCKTHMTCYDESYIKCPNSSTHLCVEQSQLCDGANDCGDGSDEDPAFCNTYKCSAGRQKCPSSTTDKCILDIQMCDGFDNCGDGSDENPAFCRNYKCPAHSLKCPKSPICIPKQFLCNGWRYCSEEADDDLTFCDDPTQWRLNFQGFDDFAPAPAP